MVASVGTVDPQGDAPGGAAVRTEMESPGSILREAREARKLSCHEVAAYLRLSSSVIEILERDDYSKLPGATFVRGYLRSYARYLGLPEERVLEIYERLSVPEPVQPAVQASVRKQLHSDDRRVRAVTYIIVVLIVALPLLWWKHEIALRLWQPEDATTGRARLSTVESQTSGDGVEAQAVLPEQAAYTSTQPLAQPDADTAHIPGSPLAAGAEDGGVSANNVAVGAQETGAGAASARPASPIPVDSPWEPPAIADEQDTLVLRFAEDSWVEIEGADGKRLLYGLMQADAVHTVSGKPPFSLVLGNPPGVSVEFNGQPFDLSSFRRGRVARFAIGSPEPRSD